MRTKEGSHGGNADGKFRVVIVWLYDRSSARSMAKTAAAFAHWLQVVLYMYNIPDMEFLVHLGDGCLRGSPSIKLSACRDTRFAGFTMPTYGLWVASMGPSQMSAYHACLQERCVFGSWRASRRKGVIGSGYGFSNGPCWLVTLTRYPAASRKPVAIWRGTSTNPVPMTKDNYEKVTCHPYMLRYCLGVVACEA